MLRPLHYRGFRINLKKLGPNKVMAYVKAPGHVVHQIGKSKDEAAQKFKNALDRIAPKMS